MLDLVCPQAIDFPLTYTFVKIASRILTMGDLGKNRLWTDSAGLRNVCFFGLFALIAKQRITDPCLVNSKQLILSALFSAYFVTVIYHQRLRISSVSY